MKIFINFEIKVKFSGLNTQLSNHDAQLLKIGIKNNCNPGINKPIPKFYRPFLDENSKDFIKKFSKETWLDVFNASV